MSLRRRIRQLTLSREHRPDLLERALFVGTIPLSDWVRSPHLLPLLFHLRPHTMLPYVRLRKIADACATIEREKVRGAFVQCGVWKGGSAGLAGKLLSSDASRELWLFDSWEGLSLPSERDVSLVDRSPGRGGQFRSSEGEVRELLFSDLHLDPERCHVVRGWFEQTLLPLRDRIGPIAILHVDCDFFDPVLFCLQTLFPQVSPGGFVILDDYGEWEGARQAADEFLEALSPRPSLIPIDTEAVFFRKIRPLPA